MIGYARNSDLPNRSRKVFLLSKKKKKKMNVLDLIRKEKIVYHDLQQDESSVRQIIFIARYIFNFIIVNLIFCLKLSQREN